MSKENRFRFDQRILSQLIRSGEVKPAEHAQYLRTLPDMATHSEKIVIPEDPPKTNGQAEADNEPTFDAIEISE